MGARGHLRTAIAFVCVLALATACGSTTKDNAEPIATGIGADSTAAPGVTGSPTAGPSGATGSSTTGGSTSSGTVSAPGTSGSGDAIKLTGGPPVRIGMHYTADFGPLLTSFGLVDSTDGPGDAAINKIVNWINANGGLGKRKLEVVMHASDPVGGSFSAQAAEACATFTQDNTVDYVISGAAATTPDLLDCLYKKKVPLLWNLHIAISDAMFKKYDGYLYQPFNMRNERQVSYITELQNAKWAPKNAKIGLLRADHPVHDAYFNGVIKPGLAKNGLKVTSEVVFQNANSAGDAGALSATAANGVLRFKQDGITHVLSVPSGGTLPYLFMQAAANQDYEPRYGFNTLDIPAFIDLNAPDGQLDGALAVGWLLTSDVLTPQRPKDNTAERLCYKITNSRSDIPSRYCEGLFWLKALFDKGAQNTPASIKATIPKLGTSYISPWTFKTDFSKGQPDGANTIRMARWGGACKCFEYYGPYKKVP